MVHACSLHTAPSGACLWWLPPPLPLLLCCCCPEAGCDARAAALMSARSTSPSLHLAGELKSTKIARFLNGFYNGKACSAAIKIGALLHPRCLPSCLPTQVKQPAFRPTTYPPFLTLARPPHRPLQTPALTSAACGCRS